MPVDDGGNQHGVADGAELGLVGRSSSVHFRARCQQLVHQGDIPGADGEEQGSLIFLRQLSDLGARGVGAGVDGGEQALHGDVVVGDARRRKRRRPERIANRSSCNWCKDWW